MPEFAIDLNVAKAQYEERRAANAKIEKIDNSRLPAGSQMYFYCKYCGSATDTLPESFTCIPRTVCKPCEILEAHGLVRK